MNPSSFRVLNRRAWLRRAGGASLAAALLAAEAGDASTPSARRPRRFHVCLAPPLVVGDPELVRTVRAAGVDTVWLAGFLYGHSPYPPELLRHARQVLANAGLASELVTVPLGHPGDSLGAMDGSFPLTPPKHWRLGQRPTGQRYAGTSLHAPATEANSAALRELRPLGFRTAFVDDDFRLARGPGEIGGCFCDDHRGQFLRRTGFPASAWTELVADVEARRLTRVLRAWLDFTSDELTASFRAQRRAFGGDLGVMVMFLGAEKAGLRLRDYRRAPFRVGELMFDDRTFGTVKGKTDELFSVLFHRRYAAAERAYSESTAYPADQLSAPHLAAKLTISTLADVRNTMLMSGLTPFPRTHWDTLAPAMRQQAEFHAALAGHRPRGPFRHFWGEAERFTGKDQPFSLWLALGVPFEVVDTPTASPDHWTFLSDFDARERATSPAAPETRWITRASAAVVTAGSTRVGETLPELFTWRRGILPQLTASVPRIEEEEPVVCAWYPSARRVLVWNLAAVPKHLTLRWGPRREPLTLGPLGSAVVADA